MEKIDAVKWEPLHLPSTNFTGPSSSAPTEYTFCPLVMELSVLAAKDSLSTTPLIFSKDLFLQLFLFPSQFLCLHQIVPLSIQLLCLTNILFVLSLTPRLPHYSSFIASSSPELALLIISTFSAYTFHALANEAFPSLSPWKWLLSRTPAGSAHQSLWVILSSSNPMSEQHCHYSKELLEALS